MVLKNYRKQKRWRKWVFLVILLFALLFTASYQIGKRSIPYMRQIALHEARNVTSQILIQSVQAQSFSLEKEQGSYISRQIQEALSSILNRAYEQFQEHQIDVLEPKQRSISSKVIYEMPLGMLLHVPFLAELGPKVPIHMRLLGDVMGMVVSKVTPYGINNALVEISVEMTVRVQVFSFFVVEELEVMQTIPLSLEVFEGEVPTIYPWIEKQTQIP